MRKKPPVTLDFGTDHEADKASLQVARTQKCAGGCGKTWDEAGGGWRGFLELEDGRICTSPIWTCNQCFEEEQDRKFQEGQAKLPPHVRELRIKVRELMTDLLEDHDGLSIESSQELAELTAQLHAEYEKLGVWPDGQIETDGPIIH